MTLTRFNGSRFWDVILKVCVPLSFFLSAAVVSHEVRISQIETNRFTDVDGAVMERILERRLLEKLPPAWLKEDIQEIKALLRELEKRLRLVEQKVK